MTVCVALLALAGRSTVESRREKAPYLEQMTPKSLADFQGCFAERVARQHVSYIPKLNGGSFSAHGGPQEYVYWVVDIDDLGAARRIRLYAINGGTARHAAIPAISSCA